jgi:DNA-binding transcriptional regulator YiaG
MQTKIQKKYTDQSLGFPVVLLNAPMIKVRGEWALHVNYNEYQKAVLKLIAHKPSRLTGSEISFIRKYFEMTARSFADRFSVKHSAVLKWEKQYDKGTNMTWSTEKDIRLFILDELEKKAAALRELYHFLEDVAQGPSEPIVLYGDTLAA